LQAVIDTYSYFLDYLSASTRSLAISNIGISITASKARCIASYAFASATFLFSIRESVIAYS